MTKLRRLIWLFAYLERHRSISYATYSCYFPSVSRRTYFRDVAVLKAAGGVIERRYTMVTVRGRFRTQARSLEGIDYIRFDLNAPLEQRSVA